MRDVRDRGARGSWSRSARPSLTTAARRHRPAHGSSPWSTRWPRPAGRTRGRPGLLRGDRGRPGAARAEAPAPRPGHPAGGRVGRPGPADGALHPAVRRARPRRRPGAAHRRRRHPAQPLPQRATAPSAGCWSSASSRSSTRTTPSPPTRSASATTTGWRPWSPIWSTPTR